MEPVWESKDELGRTGCGVAWVEVGAVGGGGEGPAGGREVSGPA